MKVAKKLKACLMPGIFLLFVLCSLKITEISTYAVTNANIPKKIISVVYDDSGSMFKENGGQGPNMITWWAQANYALQAFGALLNDQDELYITFMSEPDQVKKYDLSDTAKTVEALREVKTFSQNTPIAAVETAGDALLNYKGSYDEDTQFWLVVLTDGIPEEQTAPNVQWTPTEYQPKLDYYAGQPAPNQTEMQVKFMQIGDIQTNVKGNKRNLTIEKAGEDIIGTLNNISNQITGRMKSDGNSISLVDDKTIKLHTDLPLYAITIFSQGTYAEVTSASGSQVKLVFDQRKAKLKYPEFRSYLTDTNLIGNTITITNGNDIIPIGDYEIKFSDKVDLSKISVMTQPCIELKLTLEKDGKPIKNKGEELTAPDKFVARVIPIDPVTGNEIEMNVIPEGTVWTISSYINGNEIESIHYEAGGKKEKIDELKITMVEEPMIIQATMTLPDLLPANSEPLVIEPNIDLLFKVVKDGKELKEENGDFENVLANEVLEISVTAFNPTTGVIIDSKYLPPNVNWTLEYYLDDVLKDSTTNDSLVITASEGKNLIHASLMMPDPQGLLTTTPVVRDIIFEIGEYNPELDAHVVITRKNLSSSDVVYDNQEGIDYLSSLQDNDEIVMEVTVYDVKTGGAVNLSPFGPNAQEQWNLKYSLNGTLQDDSLINTITTHVHVGDNRLDASYQVGTFSFDMDPIEFKVYAPGVMGIESEGNSYTYQRAKLSRKAMESAGIAVLWITSQEDVDGDGIGDGSIERMDAVATNGKKIVVQNVLYEKAETDFFLRSFRVLKPKAVIKQQKDGSFYVYPGMNRIVQSFFPYVIAPGTYTVTSALSSDPTKTVETIYIIEAAYTDWIPLIVELIIIAIVLYTLGIIFLKKKFPYDFKILIQEYQSAEDGNGTGEMVLDLSKIIPRYGSNKISPWAAKYKIGAGGIRIYAADNGNTVAIDKKTLPNKSYSPIISVKNPEKHFEKIKKEIENTSKYASKETEYVLAHDNLCIWDGETMYVIKITMK